MVIIKQLLGDFIARRITGALLWGLPLPQTSYFFQAPLSLNPRSNPDKQRFD